MHVQPGDAFVVATTGLPARAIRLVTRSRVNHAGIVVDSDGTTVEAMPRGARYGRIGPRHIVIRVPDADGTAVAHAARTFVGYGYNFLDVAAFGLAFLRIRPKAILRRLSRTDRVFCSQMVVLALLAAGVRLYVDERLPQDVSPGDLLELAAAAGWVAGADEVYPRGAHPDDEKP